MPDASVPTTTVCNEAALVFAQIPNGEVQKDGRGPSPSHVAMDCGGRQSHSHRLLLGGQRKAQGYLMATGDGPVTFHQRSNPGDEGSLGRRFPHGTNAVIMARC
jgi:hypothetical protein